MRRSYVTGVMTLLLIACIPAAECAARGPYFQVPPGPRTSVRGHIRIRNGLFRTYHERWGNGVTPAGAMLLSNLGYSAAVLGAAYINPAVIGNLPVPGNLPGGGGDADDALSSGETAAEMAAEREAQLEKLTTLNEMQSRANAMLTKLDIPVTHPVVDTVAAPIDDAAAPGSPATQPNAPSTPNQQEPNVGTR